MCLSLPLALLHCMVFGRKKGITTFVLIAIPLFLGNWLNVLNKYTVVTPTIWRYAEGVCLKVWELINSEKKCSWEPSLKPSSLWGESMTGKSAYERQALTFCLMILDYFHSRTMYEHINWCSHFGRAFGQYVYQIKNARQHCISRNLPSRFTCTS